MGRSGFVVLVLVVACGGSSETPRSASEQAGDRARARLGNILHANGCTDVAQCRSAPVGERPCGGPSGYVVYCASTTDADVLSKTLADIQEADKQRNLRQGLSSDCREETAPSLDLADGECRRKR